MTGGVTNRPLGSFDHLTKFEQVAAFAFRGDSRAPEEIKADGGFNPPSSRTDPGNQKAIATEFYRYMSRKFGWNLDAAAQRAWIAEMLRYIQSPTNLEDKQLLAEYGFWRQVLEMEEYHLQGMSDNSFMKGYISTTRVPGVAFGGTTGSLGGEHTVSTAQNGWIYVVRVESGFLLKKGVGGVTKDEGEISHLGPIPWRHVLGFINVGWMAKPVVYLRPSFAAEDVKAFRQVLASLSQYAP
jgi:hypothetical protein